MLKYYRHRGHVGDVDTFSAYARYQHENSGLTLVVFVRNKYADIQYDWDYRTKVSPSNYRKISELIEREISTAAQAYVPVKNMKLVGTYGKILNIPIQKSPEDNVDKLAQKICSIFESVFENNES